MVITVFVLLFTKFVVGVIGIHSADRIIGELGLNVTTNMYLCLTPQGVSKSDIHMSLRKEEGQHNWHILNHIHLKKNYDPKTRALSGVITFKNVTYEDSGIYKLKASIKNETICLRNIMFALSKSYTLYEGESIFTYFRIPKYSKVEGNLKFNWGPPHIPFDLRSRLTTFLNGTHQGLGVNGYLNILGGQYIFSVRTESNKLLDQYVLILRTHEIEPTNVRVVNGAPFKIEIPIQAPNKTKIQSIRLVKLFEEKEWSSDKFSFDIHKKGNVTYMKIWNDLTTISHQDAGIYVVYNEHDKFLAKYRFQMTNTGREIYVKRGVTVVITYKLPAIDLVMNGLAMEWIKPKWLFTEKSFIKEQMYRRNAQLTIPNFRPGLNGAYELHIYDTLRRIVYFYSGYYNCTG